MKKERLLTRRNRSGTQREEIIINKSRLWEIIKEAILIIIGTYLISLSTNMFLLPQRLTTGGFSGIGTIFYYIMNIPLGVTIMALNIPLFIISIYKLGFKFSLKTIITTTLLSVFLEVFTYPGIITNSPADLFTSCIFGGLLTGIGLSLILKTGASSGGSDLLAQLIYKMTPAQSVSQILFGIEIAVIGAIIIVFKDINLGLYSIIAMFIVTKVIDIMFEGIYYTKVVTIITRKPEEVTEGILKDLKRGATITKGIGAHSGKENSVITCIITRPQIVKLKKIIKQTDSHALMYITTSNEVIGEGFKVIEE